MKTIKLTFLIILSILFIIGVSACSRENLPADTIDSPTADMESSGTKTDFDYPEKSEFVLEVSKDDFVVRSGEVMTIDCSLKNNSDRDYHIKHGDEVITYSYNDCGEIMNAIAIFDIFKSNSEYNRTLEITANKSGKITISATIYVKSSQYNDQYETYVYEKDIFVNVFA